MRMDASGGPCHRPSARQARSHPGSGPGQALRMTSALMSLVYRFNDALARLIDALADPTRRRRAALVFALGYGAMWLIYGLIAKSSQDLNADMAEMVVWTREPALGYPKHQPCLAWVLWAWFKIFPLSDW